MSAKSLAEPAVIDDMKNQDAHECIRKAFERIGATSLIKNAQRVYVHVPLAASLFRRGRPVQGTYLDAELAEAIALNCLHKQVTFYEAPATAHRNVGKLFEKLGYLKLAEKHSHLQLLDLRESDLATILETTNIAKSRWMLDVRPALVARFMTENLRKPLMEIFRISDFLSTT
jgi:uncharacterized protein (DUF362 family)